MKIIQIAIELSPFIKAGGLGDAVYSLAHALAEHHHVEVILPFYPILAPIFPDAPIKETTIFYTFLGQQRATSLSYSYKNFIVTFLRLDSQSDIFSTPTIYTENDTLRFSAFSSAAAAYIQNLDGIDIVHMHDWHTGLLAGLLNEPGLPSYPKRVLTIHNFSYRGYCSTQLLASSGISEENLSLYQLLRDPNASALLKGAIYGADYITTVSPSYAQDMLRDCSDQEIHDALSSKNHLFQGVLNGIDPQVWNPETDPALVVNYGAHLLIDPPTLLSKKEANKMVLYERLGLSHGYSPLMCIISRIVEQKGPEFMKQAILHAMENAYTLIIMGICYNWELQRQFSNLQDTLSTSPNVRVILDYNDALARLVYGASDMICIPSHFEPCGLTQLIAMRYGTVPLVRSTGGLADTIVNGENGFSFSQTENFQEFYTMLSSAVHTYHQEPDTWFEIMKHGMLYSADLQTMAAHYLDIYHSLL